MKESAAAFLAALGVVLSGMTCIAYVEAEKKRWWHITLVAVGIAHCFPALFMLWIAVIAW